MRSLARLILVSALLGAAAWAAASGTIQGRVSDPSGAAVPQAMVRVAASTTGYARTVQTNAIGRFIVSDLQPGVYSVQIETIGFKKFVETDVPVRVGETYVLEIKLALGKVTESIEVKAYPVQIDTTSIQLGADVTGSSVTDYPNLDRNWIALQQTLPGTVAASDDFATHNYSTNGNRTQANDYLINGADYNDLFLNTPQEVPSPDAIGEVHVVTSTLNPEYGRNSGAILVADTKLGTNSFHGDAFEFYRDTFMNARTFFANATPRFHQNQFGGTIGGPIERNRLFFFLSYQGTRQFAGPAVNTPVFSSAQAAGNWGAALGESSDIAPIPEFGDSAATCGSPCPAGTPYSELFSTGVIPKVDFNPIAVNLSKFVPPPNTPEGTFTFPQIGTMKQNQFLGRIDDEVTPNDVVYFYGFWSRSPSMVNLPFGGATLPGFGEDDSAATQQYLVSYHHIFSSNRLNDLRMSYQRLNTVRSEPEAPELPSSAGFTGINPQFPAVAGLPYINVLGFFDLGFSPVGPRSRVDDTGELSDNFTYVHARHNYKWGVDVRRGRVFNPFANENNGGYFFEGSGVFSTGLPGADFELGFPDSYQQSAGGIIDARVREIYSYIQDQWQIKQQFTLTYGMGWEIETPLTDVRNHGVAINAFRPFEQSRVFPTAPKGLVFPGDPGVTSSGYHTHYNNFGPRIGFAWNPLKNWSVRAGWGIYYDNAEEFLTLENLLAPPFSIADSGAGDAGLVPNFGQPFTSQNNVPLCLANCGTPGAVIQPAGSIPNKYPYTPPAPGSPVDFTFFEPLVLNVMDPNLNVQYVINYHLTIQRQLTPTMVATIGYVGAQGHRLESTYEANPVNSAICLATPGCTENTVTSTAPQAGTVEPLNVFGSIGTECTCTHSNYNSLQLSVRKGASHGLVFTAAYSYSHALDNASNFMDVDLIPSNFNLDYGDSLYDARHRFVASYLYKVPSIRNLAALRYLPRRLTEGWAISGVSTFQTGFPVTLIQSVPDSLQCNAMFSFYACWDRPQVVKKLRIFGDPRTSPNHEYFDPNGFAPETVGVLGNASRNFFHGPGLNNWDMSLWKDTPITEGKTLQLRIDAFNVFNHAQFANPVGDISDPRFGQILDTNPNTTARLLQLSAKFSF